MSELKTGYIYKIFNSVSDKIYIGSTFNAVRKRFSQHKSTYKHWKKNDKCNHTSCSVMLFDEDFNNCNWGIIEEVKVINRIELEKIEGKHIMINKTKCINKNIAGRNLKEYRKKYQKEKYHQNKEKVKEKYQQNKEKIKEKSKQYYNNNKEKVREYQKEYQKTDKYKEYVKEYTKTDKHKEYQKKYKKERYQQNKEAISQKRKEKYQQNKEKIKEKSKQYYNNNKEKVKKYNKKKIECLFCGCSVRKDYLKRHQKTNKCLKTQSK